MKPDFPATHDVVLIGGGHTHALVLRMQTIVEAPGAFRYFSLFISEQTCFENCFL